MLHRNKFVKSSQSALAVSFTPLFKADFLSIKKVTTNSFFRISALHFLPQFQNEKGRYRHMLRPSMCFFFLNEALLTACFVYRALSRWLPEMLCFLDLVVQNVIYRATRPLLLCVYSMRNAVKVETILQSINQNHKSKFFTIEH